jgi:hypothetical protein
VIGNSAARALGLAIAFSSATALADGPTGADQTLAQTLFDESVKLMDQGRFAEACPKLAESQRLDPGGGTLLNLGFCRQNEGKLASAWAAYNEALSQAIRDGRKDREQTARVHVDELDGKVAKLAIDVSDEARKIDQIEIRIDGTPVRQAAWGVLAPIDRGTHGIIVSAPGKREYRTSVEVKEDGTVQHVSIPALANAPIVIDRTRGSGHERPSHAQATIGWVTGAIGVALLAGGVTTGVLALDAKGKADSGCTLPGNTCTQDGFDWNERAKTYAWLADFGVGLGVAAIATGLVLIITAPKSSPSRAGARVVPLVGSSVAGAAFIATF